MPDRILRDELLDSDRWLSLQRNTHRLAFVCLIPKADPLGNMEAGDGTLWRIWREPLKLDNRHAVPEILEALVTADLVRVYEVESKRFIHIPRYRQRLRYLGHLCPPSPWTLPEEKQRLERSFTGRPRGDSQALTRRAPTEVKRSEVKRSEENLARTRAREAPPTGPPTSATPEHVKTVLEKLKPKPERPKARTREEQLAFLAAKGIKL